MEAASRSSSRSRLTWLAALLLGLLVLTFVRMLQNLDPRPAPDFTRRVEEHLAALARDDPGLFGGLIRRDDDVSVASRIDPATWSEEQRERQRARSARVSEAPEELREALLAVTRRATDDRR